MNKFTNQQKFDKWDDKAKNFINLHWYKLSLLLLIALIFTYKDLSIRLDLSSPFSKRQPPRIEERFRTPPSQNPPTLQQQFTEKLQQNSRQETFSLLPAFLLGGSKAPKSLKAALKNVSNKKKKTYVKQYAHVAVEEMQRTGVPASIILGQALLHGLAGTSDLSKQHHNHFSITCGSTWEKTSVELIGMCYRKYESTYESYQDHSQLVTTGRFANLTQYSSTDYKKWAKGLKTGGYSLEENYDQLLIETIKTFNLDKYDE